MLTLGTGRVFRIFLLTAPEILLHRPLRCTKGWTAEVANEIVDAHTSLECTVVDFLVCLLIRAELAVFPPAQSWLEDARRCEIRLLQAKATSPRGSTG